MFDAPHRTLLDLCCLQIICLCCKQQQQPLQPLHLKNVNFSAIECFHLRSAMNYKFIQRSDFKSMPDADSKKSRLNSVLMLPYRHGAYLNSIVKQTGNDAVQIYL